MALSTCERPPVEIGAYVSERQGKLQACIQAEKKRAPSGWPDALPISFVIDAQGPLRNIAVQHRFFRDGPLAACVALALAGDLGPSSGADCPGEFSVDLRGLR
jgi:hypothetical protein